MDESEKRALERLRRIDRQWPAFKWVLISLGFLNIYNGLSSYLRHDDHAVGLLYGLIGFAVIAIAIRDWHGNASRRLLLHMYKDQ